jgi:hypothetical protein
LTSNEFGNPDISAFIIREMAADIGGEFDGRPERPGRHSSELIGQCGFP